MQQQDQAKTTGVVEQRVELAPYRQIFANARDAIAILDPRGTYVEQNQAHRRLLGHGIDELRGRTPALHVGEDLFERIHATLEREGTYHGELVARARDEQLKPINLTAFTVRDETGEPICHVWIKHDLSESRRAAESLARSEERYRALVDAASNVIHGTPTKDGTAAAAAAAAREPSQYLSPAADGADLHEQERARLHEAEQSSRAEAEAAQQRLEFLAEASNVLSASLDFQTTLATVAQLVVPRLADWCAVDLLTEEGGARRLAMAHADSRKAEWGTELYRRYPPDMSAPRGVPQVLRTGRSEFYPDVTDDVLAGWARDEQHLAIMRGLAVKSIMVVPLAARGRTLGAITLVTAESQRRYTFDDLAFAEDLARRVGLAVDNARLYLESGDIVRSKDQAVALLDTLLASAPVGMAFLDRELRFVRVNDAMAAIDELPVEAHLGRSLSELRPAMAAAVEPHVRQVLRTGRPLLNIEITGHDRAGAQQDLLCSYYPVRSQDNELIGVGAVVADITSRKRAEAELHQAKESAEAASAAKDHFLAMLSHELRTPLTPVLTAASMLGEQAGLPADVRTWVEMIRRNVELEARLIDDLLDLTRIERGKLELRFETLDAHELVRQALEICGENIRDKHLGVSTELHATRHAVRADSARLRQVFWNLINNAVKFTPANGSLVLRSCNEPDGSIRIDVTDTGIGIDAEMMPRLFHAFEQGERAITRRFGGLGLGLSITKALLDAHGGRIAVLSEGRNRGTTFSVTLHTVEAAPATDAGPALSPSRQSATSPPGDEHPSRPRRILLVEDHLDTSRILSRLLASTGHEVRTASTIGEAHDIARREPPEIVISDIGLPDGSGLDLMRALKQRFPAVRGIALSGFGMDNDIARSQDAGFVEHIVKPINFQQLAAAIERLTSRD